MKRFQEKREAFTTFTGDICPRIMEKIEETILGTTTCDVTLASKEIFEVVIGIKNFIVDIRKKSCTYRKYDLTGIPCVHAAAVLMHINVNILEYVHPWYSRHEMD